MFYYTYGKTPSDQPPAKFFQYISYNEHIKNLYNFQIKNGTFFTGAIISIKFNYYTRLERKALTSPPLIAVKAASNVPKDTFCALNALTAVTPDAINIVATII